MEDRDVESWRKQMQGWQQQQQHQRQQRQYPFDTQQQQQQHGPAGALAGSGGNGSGGCDNAGDYSGGLNGGSGGLSVGGDGDMVDIDPAVQKSDLLLNEIAIVCQMCHHYASSLLAHPRLGPLLRDYRGGSGKMFRELTSAAQQLVGELIILESIFMARNIQASYCCSPVRRRSVAGQRRSTG